MLLQVTLHVSVVSALHHQNIFVTVNMLMLEHPDLGYTDSPGEMLTHLKIPYDGNRGATLASTPWKSQASTVHSNVVPRWHASFGGKLHTVIHCTVLYVQYVHYISFITIC